MNMKVTEGAECALRPALLRLFHRGFARVRLADAARARV